MLVFSFGKQKELNEKWSETENEMESIEFLLSEQTFVLHALYVHTRENYEGERAIYPVNRVL